MIQFEWDEQKRLENLRKHGLDFEDIQAVFENELVTDIDDRFEYGEIRYYSLGCLQGMVVVISHTEDDELVRVISFRKAERYEEEIYFTQIRN